MRGADQTQNRITSRPSLTVPDSHDPPNASPSEIHGGFQVDPATSLTAMATREYRIVSGGDSEIHDEPHIEGSRVTVRDVYVRVEQRGLNPGRVAERYNLDIAAVYEALAYYHNNPEAMQRVEERHERAGDEAKQRSALSPPEN